MRRNLSFGHRAHRAFARQEKKRSRKQGDANASAKASNGRDDTDDTAFREADAADATDGNAQEEVGAAGSPRKANDASAADEEPDPFDATCRKLAEQCALTGREAEVLGHLARGRTNTRIAEDLCISPATVRGHIRHIYTKLDVHDRQELIDLFQ